MALTLIIPDLVRLAVTARRFTALETLLARATHRPAPGNGLPGVLADTFGLPSASVAVAPLTRLADGGTHDTACWFRADPVQLVADRDQLLMSPLATLAVREEEAQALAGSFNTLYENDGYKLEIPRPARWYLRVPGILQCVTHDSAQIAGGPVLDFMPTGPDASRLKQLMNEMQMLFHEHPVNQAREAAGQATINAAWLWGGGHLPEITPKQQRQVVTNLPLVQGLALFTGSTCTQWPAPLDELLPDTNAMLALDAWDGESLWQIETEVAQPLLHGLRSGRLAELSIYPGGRTLFNVSRAGMRKFWRRRKPLATLLANT